MVAIPVVLFPIALKSVSSSGHQTLPDDCRYIGSVIRPVGSDSLHDALARGPTLDDLLVLVVLAVSALGHRLQLEQPDCEDTTRTSISWCWHRAARFCQMQGMVEGPRRYP